MSESQPAWQHSVAELVQDQQLDQTLAHAVNMGLTLGTLWISLRERNVSDEAATNIVCCYLSEVLQMRGQQG